MKIVYYFEFLTRAVLAGLCCLALLPVGQANAKEDVNYDVVVIAGTPAGIAAAVAAGRMGKSVIIIEQSPVLGGMLASGVLRLG